MLKLSKSLMICGVCQRQSHVCNLNSITQSHWNKLSAHKIAKWNAGHVMYVNMVKNSKFTQINVKLINHTFLFQICPHLLACNCYVGTKYLNQTACKHAHYVYAKIICANPEYCAEHTEPQSAACSTRPKPPKRKLQPKAPDALMEEAKMDHEIACLKSHTSEFLKLVDENRSKYKPSDITEFIRSLKQCKRAAAGKLTVDYRKYRQMKQTMYGNLKKKFTKQLRFKVK